jgi:hypothetical protein
LVIYQESVNTLLKIKIFCPFKMMDKYALSVKGIQTGPKTDAAF